MRYRERSDPSRLQADAPPAATHESVIFRRVVRWLFDFTPCERTAQDAAVEPLLQPEIHRLRKWFWSCVAIGTASSLTVGAYIFIVPKRVPLLITESLVLLLAVGIPALAMVTSLMLAWTLSSRLADYRRRDLFSQLQVIPGYPRPLFPFWYRRLVNLGTEASAGGFLLGFAAPFFAHLLGVAFWHAASHGSLVYMVLLMTATIIGMLMLCYTAVYITGAIFSVALGTLLGFTRRQQWVLRSRLNHTFDAPSDDWWDHGATTAHIERAALALLKLVLLETLVYATVVSVPLLACWLLLSPANFVTLALIASALHPAYLLYCIMLPGESIVERLMFEHRKD